MSKLFSYLCLIVSILFLNNSCDELKKKDIWTVGDAEVLKPRPNRKRTLMNFLLLVECYPFFILKLRLLLFD